MRAGRGHYLDQHADADSKPGIGQDRLQTPSDPGLCAWTAVQHHHLSFHRATAEGKPHIQRAAGLPRRGGCGYGLDMAARKRPTPEDAVTARRILLDGLTRDADISGLMTELAPLHPRNDTFPGEIFLRLAADALDWCGASREQPLTLEGIRERYLPECTVRGRQNKKLQYAILAAAALHGGAEPDLLDKVAWWQTDDFWQYALYAAVAYIRAAANRAGVPARRACQELTRRSARPPG